MSWLPGKTCDVVAVELNASVIKTVAAYLEVLYIKKSQKIIIKQLLRVKPLVAMHLK